MEHLIVADTNLLFECRALEELPWGDIGVDPLVIALTRPVIGEIDRHKRGSGRTRRRAMEISGRIRGMLKANQSEETIREQEPRVVLRMLPMVQPDADLREDLDYGQNDDRLVGIASALGKQGDYASVVLLTHDSVAASTARGVGVPFLLIPDTWLRPPEETSEAKQILELRRDLETYRSQEPNIEIRLIGDDGETRLVRRVARALASEEVDRLIEALRGRHPIQTDFGVPASKTLDDGTEISYDAPGEDAIAAYTSTTYPDWIARCRGILEALHERRVEMEPDMWLQFGISNSGTRPGTRVRVTFEARGDLRLVRRSNTSDQEADDAESPSAEPMPRFPPPPAAPQATRIVKRPAPPPAKGLGVGGVPALARAAATLQQSDLARAAFPSYMRDLDGLSKFARATSGMDDLLGARRQWEELQRSTLDHQPSDHTILRPIDPAIYSLHRTPPHDPEAFYYDDWTCDIPVVRGALTCDLFRHRGDEEVFGVEVVFTPHGDVRGAVECTVHAENLTAPVMLRVVVSRTVDTYDLLELAEAMVAASS